MISIKLPKNLKHWLKKCNIKYKPRCSWYFSHLKSNKYFWRVDCFGNLCRSCGIEDFDRWANSEEYSSEMPNTFREFKALVLTLEHFVN